MNLQNLKIFSVFMLLLCLSCHSNNDDNADYDEYIVPIDSNLATCDNKVIIKTFDEELGFLIRNTDMSIDRIFYYFFRPVTLNDDFSELLLFCLRGEPGA